MVSISEALAEAEARKLAVFGEDSLPGLRVSNDRFSNGAVYLGFDIDLGELGEILDGVGAFFCRQSPTVGLFPLFRAAWADGLLTGLMLHRQLTPTPPDPTPGS